MRKAPEDGAQLKVNQRALVADMAFSDAAGI
jgi:hypothetical protein